jgi:hypothetical protein
MASGDLTASAPVLVDASDVAALKVAIDALNLTAATDNLWIVPIGHGTQVAVFKVERAA